MNFLAICQELASACSIPGSGPTTVVNQTGELGRVVRWARQAWIDIQLKNPYWHFLRKNLSFTLTAGQQQYTLAQMGATDLREIDLESLRTYHTSLGFPDEQWLVNWGWDTFYDTYRFGYGRQTQGRPMVFAIDPADKSLYLGPSPDTNDLTVVGRYWTKAVSLAADGDTPACPDEFHQVIVWRALLKYAGYEAAPDAKQQALEEYGPMIRALERDQLGALSFGNPLA